MATSLAWTVVLATWGMPGEQELLSLSWGICSACLGGSLGMAAWAGFSQPQLLPALSWAAQLQVSGPRYAPFWNPEFPSCTHQCQEGLQQSHLGFQTRTGSSPVALGSAGPPVVTVARLGAPGAASCLSEYGRPRGWPAAAPIARQPEVQEGMTCTRPQPPLMLQASGGLPLCWPHPGTVGNIGPIVETSV